MPHLCILGSDSGSAFSMHPQQPTHKDTYHTIRSTISRLHFLYNHELLYVHCSLFLHIIPLRTLHSCPLLNILHSTITAHVVHALFSTHAFLCCVISLVELCSIFHPLSMLHFLTWLSSTKLHSPPPTLHMIFYYMLHMSIC